MISKELFISKLRNEVRILKHLAEKATTSELLNFQFSQGQRTTAQWMAYIAFVGEVTTKEILLDDGSGFATFTTRSDSFQSDDFAKTIDANLQSVIDMLQDATDDKLLETKVLRGASDTRAGHMMGVYNMYIAYKTQIFLQLKAAGLADLGTMNLWSGMDIPAKA